MSLKDNELREVLAEYAHQAWSGWMDYLFSESMVTEDGDVRIRVGLVDRWERQAATAYADLPENEKESDRAEADKILAIQLEHGYKHCPINRQPETDWTYRCPPLVGEDGDLSKAIRTGFEVEACDCGLSEAAHVHLAQAFPFTWSEDGTLVTKDGHVDAHGCVHVCTCTDVENIGST